MKTLQEYRKKKSSTTIAAARHHRVCLSEYGFTLIEVIVVLILFSILAAVVVNHGITTNANLRGEVEIVKAHLRFAQMKSMNTNVDWGIQFAGTSYTLYENGAASTSSLPQENSNTHSMAGSVTVSSTVNPITLDRWGSPGTTSITVTLTEGSASSAITVTRKTGFIP